MSKRKCRVPMRLAPDKAEESLPTAELEKPMRKTKVDPAVANRAVAATSREDSSPRKRRDGWDKYPWLCTDCDEVRNSFGYQNAVLNLCFWFSCQSWVANSVCLPWGKWLLLDLNITFLTALTFYLGRCVRDPSLVSWNVQ